MTRFLNVSYLFSVTEPCNTKKRNALDLPHTITSGTLKPEDWVNAPEFVPFKIRSKSYAQAVTAKEPNEINEENSKKKLCPYAENDGICKYPTGECTYLHGDMCDMCGRAALHPYNEEQRKEHTQVNFALMFLLLINFFCLY